MSLNRSDLRNTTASLQWRPGNRSGGNTQAHHSHRSEKTQGHHADSGTETQEYECPGGRNLKHLEWGTDRRERERERSQDGRWTNVYVSIKDALRLLSELLLFHNIMQHGTCLTQQKNEHSIHYTVCYGCKYQLLKIITWLFLVLLCLRVVYCKWYPKCSFFNVQLSKVNEFPLANWAIWSSVTTITNK